MLRQLLTLLLGALPIGLAAQDRAAHYYPEAEGRLTAEMVDDILTFRNERMAMAVLAQVCISNRNNASRAERMLRKSGYFRGFYTMDSDGKAVMWFHDGDLPAVAFSANGRIIQRCSILIDKHPRRFADLEAQLDDATKEDLQRYTKNMLNHDIGERGWVLRPGFEHGVVILRSSNGHTGIALRYLGD